MPLTGAGPSSRCVCQFHHPSGRQNLPCLRYLNCSKLTLKAFAQFPACINGKNVIHDTAAVDLTAHGGIYGE